MKPALPPELVEKIVVTAVNECGASKKDLLNYALANHFFPDLALPILYLDLSF